MVYIITARMPQYAFTAPCADMVFIQQRCISGNCGVIPDHDRISCPSRGISSTLALCLMVPSWVFCPINGPWNGPECCMGNAQMTLFSCCRLTTTMTSAGFSDRDSPPSAALIDHYGCSYTGAARGERCSRLLELTSDPESQRQVAAM